MNRLRRCLLLTLTASVLAASLGCGLTVGPRVETRYVMVKPGVPVRILENRTVTGRVLGDEGQAVKQDIGGWFAMPSEHFDELMRRIQEAEKRAKALEGKP